MVQHEEISSEQQLPVRGACHSSSSNTRVCRRASIVSISRTAVGQSERVECLRCLPHALISYYLSLLAAQLSASWPCRLQTPVHVRHEVQKTAVSFTCFIVFIHFRYFFYEVACLLFCFCLFGFLISEKISKLSKCPLLLLSAVVLLSDSRGQADHGSYVMVTFR